MKRKKLWYIGLLILSLILLSVTVSMATDQPAASPDAKEVFVTIPNFSFTPAAVTVAPGTPVT